jgi:hypothetical protein
MNTKSSSFRKVAIASVLSVMSLGFIFASGQSRSEAAPAKDGAASIAKGSKADTEAYTVELKAAGDYKATQEGNTDLLITSKGDFHINPKFPVKFKLTDPAPEGVKYPKALLKREDGTFSDTKGSFKVPFVAAKSGTAVVSGVLSLSVCNDKQCLMEKLDLELEVDVK